MQTEKYEQPTDIAYNKKIIDQWVEIFSALESIYSDNNLSFANLSLYRFLTFFLCEPDFTPHIIWPDPVRESIAYMSAHIGEILSVDDLADRQNLSASHFSGLFRSTIGTSPIDYFIKLKIRYACQLLSQTDLRVSEIGEKIGYDDSFYFSRLFKKMTGKSPRNYKDFAGSNKRTKST